LMLDGCGVGSAGYSRCVAALDVLADEAH